MRLLMALILLIPSMAFAGSITWENDGADGWAAGDDWDSANIDEVQEEVDDNAERLAADDVYYCELYAGADLWAQCAAAYTAAKTAGVRSVILQLPRGQFTVTSAPLDFCEESGRSVNTGGKLRGHGGSISGDSGTTIRAGAGFASSAIAKTSYTIAVDVVSDDGSTRDEISCVGCDFRTAGIRRGSLIETSGFATSGNNYTKSNSKLPLKVYRAEATKLIVEDETQTNPSLTAVGPTATGDIRLLRPMVETCSGTWSIENFRLATDGYADMGVHHRPDNYSNAECSAVDTPYSGTASEGTDCTDVGDGTGLPLISIGGGLKNMWIYDPVYFGVAITAPEAAGQADHYSITDGSYIEGGLISVWYDSLQAQPGVLVRDSQLRQFQMNGLRVSSGTGVLDNATVISSDADCVADTYGTSAHVWVGYQNVDGFIMEGVTNIETKCGEGIHVVDGGSTESQRRVLDLSGGYIQANSTDVATLVSAPDACLDINLSGTRFVDSTGPSGAAAEIVFGNSNQATCRSFRDGVPSLTDNSPAGFVPVLSITDDIPEAPLMVAAGDDGDCVEFDANGDLVSAGSGCLTSTTTLSFLTTGSISGKVGLNSTGVGGSVTATGMLGNLHYYTGAGAATFNLPTPVEAGLNACFYVLNASVMTIDVGGGSDTITLDGAMLSAGDSIDSGGTAGEFICLLGTSTTNWTTLGRAGAWVNGN